MRDEKVCAWVGCGATFTVSKGSRQKYCSEACGVRVREGARLAAKRAATELRAAARCCVDCPATMEGRPIQVLRCRSCAGERDRVKKRAARRARRGLEGPGQSRAEYIGSPQASRRGTGLGVAKQRTKQKAVAVAPKARMKALVSAAKDDARREEKRRAQSAVKPNWAPGADLFPGWDGIFPPSFTPFERELLASGRGRLVPDRRFVTKGSGQSGWRAPDGRRAI